MTVKNKVQEKQWVKRAKELSKQFAESAAQIDEQSVLPKENLKILFDEGFDTAILPKEKGGAGISYRTYGEILLQIAKGCPATACIWLMHAGAAESLIGLSSPEVSSYYLTELLNGKRFANALSEPSSGNLFLNPVQEALPVEGGWSMDGAKRFVSGSEIADHFLVNVSIDGTPTFFGVKHDETIFINDVWDALGMRGTRSQLIEFRDTLLKSEHRSVLPKPGTQNLVTLGLPIISLGIAEAALDDLISFAKNKPLGQTGKTLAELEWIQFGIAEAHVSLKSAKLLTAHLLDLADQHSEETTSVSMEAKMLANQVAKTITDLSIRAGGGTAYTKLLPFERHFRNAQAGGLMAYSSELCHKFVGKKLLDIE